VQLIAAEGALFTVTVVDEAALAQPPTLAITEYAPAWAVVTPIITGF
jgi:hypothetical protein